LDPTGWFSLGHGIQDFATNSDGLEVPVLSGSQSTVYLWTPPPAAAFLALEQLSYARLKRPHLAHIVVCPRLMTAYWRKLLHKQSDLVFTLPCGVRPALGAGVAMSRTSWIDFISTNLKMRRAFLGWRMKKIGSGSSKLAMGISS